ncbi:hypothetical protein [Futiania mangrovi]|uniref:Uncharacterized protein n=1 Tax=Futiania mangrovi TaxID=2959716 RepID=A0A9J6PGZ0_9PROT|nr:hypothetical protein [Futiania mangrovii]MCP1337075.1 hypothetical protein [Futiania mangrovii]
MIRKAAQLALLAAAAPSLAHAHPGHGEGATLLAQVLGGLDHGFGIAGAGLVVLVAATLGLRALRRRAAARSQP